MGGEVEENQGRRNGLDKIFVRHFQGMDKELAFIVNVSGKPFSNCCVEKGW